MMEGKFGLRRYKVFTTNIVRKSGLDICYFGLLRKYFAPFAIMTNAGMRYTTLPFNAL